MKLKPQDIELMKKASDPAFFQDKIFPMIPKKHYHKILVKNTTFDQKLEILRDYKTRGLTDYYNQFLKLCQKKEPDIETFL